MCKTLKSHECKKNQFLFRYGDKGDAFYMILRGQISVTAPKDEKKAKVINQCMVQARQKVNEVMSLSETHLVNYLT